MLQFLVRSPFRPITITLVIAGCGWLGYFLWNPGIQITDGRHDLGKNGIWLGHGWLGDNSWFERNGKQQQLARFRDPESIRRLASLQHHIHDIFPHLCPSEADGRLPPVDSDQTRRFLEIFKDFRVLPWVGGALGEHAFPENPRWRMKFAESISRLMREYPDFAGVHLNIEPMPSGDSDFLRLLDEIKKALPHGKILSIAAYPPPTRWHPHSDVHWDEAYYRAVATRADQLAVMMYDTALEKQKLYRKLMLDWTREILEWSQPAQILLGLPAYDDTGVPYHHPEVENLRNALMGIHAGLLSLRGLPSSYQGTALYSEWEMNDTKWKLYREHFLKSPFLAPDSERVYK